MMKWRKLGKIFDPTEHHLSNNCHEYAQSPQALVFDDFIRIYFSTRERENNGKFLSHISFVDMDKSFRNVISVSKHTVIELGKLGCFDEHGIFPINPLRYQDKVFAYTCGWSRRVSVSVDTSIGFAISQDNGLTFAKIGEGPVLTSSLHEPFLINDPFVRFINGKFHMWYSFGTRWINHTPGTPAERVYKIGHATSSNGFTWEKEGRQLIKDKLDRNECQALPTIIRFKSLYHMFFIYRHAIGFRQSRDKGYRIGYAFSDDLQSWVRDDKNVGIDVSDSGWDSHMMCYPNAFECDGNIYLLYNGNEFGRYGFGLAILENY